MLNNTDLISVQEAAEVGQITEGYIRRKFGEGKLGDLEINKHFLKIGRDWFVLRSAWLDFVNERNKKKRKVVS